MFLKHILLFNMSVPLISYSMPTCADLIIKKIKNNSHTTVRFLFLSLFCSPRPHLFDQKYIKNSNIVKYNYIFKITFLFEYNILM